MTKANIASTLLLCAVSTIATAGVAPSIPEPETLSLIAIGAIALIIARTRKRK